MEHHIYHIPRNLFSNTSFYYFDYDTMCCTASLYNISISTNSVKCFVLNRSRVAHIEVDQQQNEADCGVYANSLMSVNTG